MYSTKHSNTYPDIILTLATPQDRNNFLKSINDFKQSKKDQLRLQHIGFTSPMAFHVNENLTRDNYDLLKAALKLKKQNLIYSVFSRRGLINVKITKDDEPIRITNQDDIRKIQQSSSHLFRNSSNHSF